MADNATHAQKKRKLFDELGTAVDKMVTNACNLDTSNRKDDLARAVAWAAVEYVNAARLTRATDEAKKAKQHALEDLAMGAAWHHHVDQREAFDKERVETYKAAKDVVAHAHAYITATVAAMTPAKLEEQAKNALNMFGLTAEGIVQMAQHADRNDPTQYTIRYRPVRLERRCMLLGVAALCKFMHTKHGVKIDRLYTNDGQGARVGFSICGPCDKPKK